MPNSWTLGQVGPLCKAVEDTAIMLGTIAGYDELDPASVDDTAWADFLYMRSNPKGMHAERWRHVHGCGRFFNCVRDTVSDRISATYKPGQTPPR